MVVVPMGRENIFGWIDGEGIVWWPSFRWGGRIISGRPDTDD